jgi:hypothetical protein
MQQHYVTHVVVRNLAKQLPLRKRLDFANQIPVACSRRLQWRQKLDTRDQHNCQLLIRVKRRATPSHCLGGHAIRLNHVKK